MDDLTAPADGAGAPSLGEHGQVDVVARRDGGGRTFAQRRGDRAAFRYRFQRQGYLYLSGVFDHDTVWFRRSPLHPARRQRSHPMRHRAR